MLPAIDEIHEDNGERIDGTVVQRLTHESKAKCNLPEFVGGHGPWQYRHWIVFFVATTCNSLFLFSTFPFSSPSNCSCKNISEIQHGEKLPFISSTNCSIQNCTTNASDLLPMAKSRWCENNHWSIKNSEEDNIFCNGSRITVLAKCITLLGFLFSGVTTNFLTVKFGRRRIALCSGLFLFISALAISWTRSEAAFLILRLIVSLGMMNIYLLSILSLLENVGEEYRLLYIFTGHLGWGLGHFILPLVTWLTRSWTQFSIILSFVPLLQFISLCFIPESVETYVYKGLRASAQKIIRRAAWSNGCPTHDVEQFTQTFTRQRQQEIANTECKNRSFQRCLELVLLFIICLSSSFVFFTCIWLTDLMNARRGAYFALDGTTEIASVLILMFFTCFVPQKYLWSATTIMASISLLLMYAKSSDDLFAIKPLPTFPYLFTMFFSSSAWTIVLLKALFQPLHTATSKWNTVIAGIAICVGILAASLIDLMKFDFWSPKFYVIFGIPNLTIGASVAVIPNRYFNF